MMTTLFLAHEGHSHGPDLGLTALLVAGGVLAVLLLVGLARHRWGSPRGPGGRSGEPRAGSWHGS